MLEEIINERKRKLDAYKKFNNPYPARVKRTAEVADVLEKFAGLLRNKKKFYVVGRVRALREQGKIIFADLKDGSDGIQIVFRSGDTTNFEAVRDFFDIGDFIEVCGRAFKTSRGEKSVLVSDARIIAKGIRPIPKEWYGLEDAETRLRKRYLDLLLREEVKEIFIKKKLFWKTIREELDKNDFLEVEMPVLENVPGGAEAEPFVTKMNALNREFFLRISLELPLKKLLVGGFERVYEIGRVFRNEGISREHLQDYASAEFYAAYWDYNRMMKFVEPLYKKVVKNVCGSLKTKFGKSVLNWGGKWKTIEYFEVFLKETGVDLNRAGIPKLKEEARKLGIDFAPGAGRGRLIDLIYKKSVRGKLIQPCFLVNPPVEIEPLAKRLEGDETKVERFQIVVAGTELGKGFSELNDPIDQRRRFEEQMKLREEGDKEAQRLDEDYLEAMEYGMPPSAGFGVSERFFAVLMDKSIRETVIFPLMKENK